MGLFGNKAKPQQAAPAAADLERPPHLESAASAPAGHGPDVQQQPGDKVHRAQSEPAGGAKQRKPQKDTLTPEQRATLRHVQLLTKVMDNAVTIPIIGRKIGLDAVIGLVPYAGDMAGATVGTYIITRALKFNMPKRLVLRMMANQAIDATIGIIPFIGDIFDIGFKANTRNAKLLEEHLEHPKQAKRSDTCFLLMLFFLVVVVPMFLVLGIIAAIIVGICAALGKL